LDTRWAGDAVIKVGAHVRFGDVLRDPPVQAAPAAVLAGAQGRGEVEQTQAIE